MVTLFLHSRGILFLFSSYYNLNKVSILLFFKIFHPNHKWSSKHLELLKIKKASMKNILALGELNNKIESYAPLLPSVLIYSHDCNKNSSCPTCQSDKGNDNVEDFRRTPYSVDKTE